MKSESLTAGTGAVVFPTCWQQPQPGEGTRTGAGGSGGWPAARRLARSSRADLGRLPGERADSTRKRVFF